jgi:hypothetical protein
LGAWHANLLRIERRKCVLFTDDQTLYSVFVPCLRKPQFEQIADVFGQALFRSLRLTEFSQTQIETILDNLDPLRSGRTNSRSVLGSMNDLAYQLQWMIAALGGLGRCAIDVINQQLNRIPMGTIKPHVYSVDALQACLGEYL